ncbi:hypothetical protein [Paenibacillus thermotolerans]|uniref:hypothetical protein n=1 Tax=Paenibacillus thermotolerans TaxID=3027807 RepID=UPI0023675F44|nr:MULTISPECIES: hypothetical protein [unclassified Paenibacillus]
MKITCLIATFFSVILLMTSGCSKNEPLITEKLQSAFPDDVQTDEIYHAEIFKNGVLVFFGSNDGLGAAFFKQKSERWEWAAGTGYPSLHPHKGLSAMHSNREEISLYISYGVITDPEIVEVRAGETKAKMIQTADGTRIWFITYENPLGQDGSLPPISGKDHQGHEIITM